VLAGARSGRPRVITHKIARLLQAGYEPGRSPRSRHEQAAQEMRERAKELIGAARGQAPRRQHFHSLGCAHPASDASGSA